MRRKNGYTLTEILVVILLLAVVGGIIIFNVNSILNKNKEKSYERYITNVKSSAETYASLNFDKVSDLYENKSFTYITVGELIDQGFLDEKTTNPYTNQRIGRDELIKLSLSTDTGDLTITYPATEDNKEVFLSSVVLSTTVGKEVNCMDGIGTYQLALSDEHGKLILDKDTLLNEYKFTCKLPEGFDKRAGDMSNELGSTEQIGTYEMEYYWVSKSGTKGTGKRYLKVVPDTITITYNVDLIEGLEWPVDDWTNSTCMGKINGKTCTKEVLVGYNYSSLSQPTRTGYDFVGWYREQQKYADAPGNGIHVTSSNKVVDKTSHTLYAHWDRKKYGVTLNSKLNERPAVDPGDTSVEAKFNVVLPNVRIPARYFDVSFNLNDSRNSNGTTEATADASVLRATWNFEGYHTESGKYYIDSQGHGTEPWTELADTELYATWTDGKITLPNASRPGYEFLGWYTDPVNGVKKENTDTYEETTELYAHWKAKEYTVNLIFNDQQENTASHANETITSFKQIFDDNFDNLYYPTRNGYDFVGWFTEQGAKITKETRATNDYLIIDNNGLTLTADWKAITYKLELDLNGHPDMSYPPVIESTMERYITYDSPLEDPVEPIEVPSVKGWNFLGWYHDDVKVFNADGYHNTDIDTYFNIHNNWKYLTGLKLKAKWEQKGYTLTVDLLPDSKMSYSPKLSDGNENQITTYTMTFDSSTNSIIPYGVLDGWKFLGYYDSEDRLVYDSQGKYVESTLTEYFNGSKWNYEGNLNVHAKWNQESYDVIIKQDSPSADDIPTYSRGSYTFTYDELVPDGKIIVPSFLDGYEFQGWYDDDNNLVFKADGTINEALTNYFHEGKWVMPSSIVITPKWKANGYVITFNQPEATTKGTQSLNINYNTALSSITVPVRKYDVTYKLNDETGSQRASHVDNFVKEWTFDGYYTESDNQYYDGSGNTSIVYREPRDIDLYARWSNGSLENMPQPTRTGYTFEGWYLDDGTFNNKVENGYTVTEDMTLYAKWTANKHKITLNNNKASVPGTEELDVTFDEAISNIDAPVKMYTVTLDKNYPGQTEVTKTAKWTFLGYFTQENGAGTRYFDANGRIDQTYTLDEDITLYAAYEGGTIELPEYTRDDYIFQGWYYDSGRQATSSDTYEENTRLKIHWQSEDYNLTLSVDATGMSSNPKVSPDSYKMYMHEKNNNVISVPTDYVGWNFLGWYAGDVKVFDSTGKWNSAAIAYWDSEGNWIKRDNVTLKTKWSPKTYALTLNPGSLDTTIAPNNHTLTYDSKGPEQVSIPKHVIGYAFDGYYYNNEMIYDASGYIVKGNSIYDSQGYYRKDSATQLVARYTEYANMLELKMTKLSDMPETPKLANSKYEMVENSAQNNTVNVPASITGFTFLGWYAGSEKVFDDMGSFVESSYFDSTGKWLKSDGAVLESKYVANQTTVTFRNQVPGDDAPTAFVSPINYRSKQPTSVSVPDELDQYEFKGWYYGDTQVYDENGNKNLSASQFFNNEGRWMSTASSIVLNAKWEALDIKVNLDLNANDLPFTPQVNSLVYTMELNSDHNKHINIPTDIDPEYSFQGWYDGDTQVYDENGDYNPTASSYFTPEGKWVRRSSVTLKAKWLKI